jgi:hypothetical protein
LEKKVNRRSSTYEGFEEPAVLLFLIVLKNYSDSDEGLGFIRPGHKKKIIRFSSK